ncbi:hypothetical protein OF83DRAFT_1179744 [Amylostereum chailletii]|nr:hypothetical protein OF83DRAFT_1179744 [Amylostereum chailletii]
MDQAVASTRVALRTLAWGPELRAYGANAPLDHLSQLVSNEWLRDEVLNVLSLSLFARVRLDTRLADQIIIAPVTLDNKIRTTASKDYHHSTLLVRYHDYIQRMNPRWLYFLSFVNGNHWVAVCVDFETKSVKYGDSSPFPKQLESMKKILRWLKYAFKVTFSDEGNTLRHGTQHDSHSCGPCAMNCIEHAIFGVALFTPAIRCLCRLQYFLCLVHEHEEYMSARESAASLRREDTDLPAEVTSDAFFLMSAADLVDELEIPPSGFLLACDSGQDTSSSVSESEHPPPSSNEERESSSSCTDDLSVAEPSSAATSDVEMRDVHDLVAPSVGHGKRSRSDTVTAALRGPQATTPKRPRISSDSHKERTRTLPGGETYLPHPPDTVSPLPSNSALRPDTFSVVPKTVYDSVGVSRSNRAQKELKQRMADGTFEINKRKLDNFKKKCLDEDADAKFKTDALPWKVYHSHCNAYVTTGVAYAASPFIQHVAKCLGKNRPRTTTLMSMWAGQPTVVKSKTSSKKADFHTSAPAFESAACRGITVQLEPRIENLIQRGVKSGGGTATKTIAKEVYGKGLNMLTKKEKEDVKQRQSHSRMWEVIANNDSVFARDCRKTLSRGRDETAICDRCSSVKNSPPFKGVKVPEGKNAKYINKEYIDESGAMVYAKVKGLESLFRESAQGSVYVRYVTGVLNGKYKDRMVFNGLLRAIVDADDRKKQGKGLQNMHYTPHLEEFSHIAVLTSPDVYRLMKPHFQISTERGLQIRRAAMPRFPITICKETFDAVEAYIKARHYDGPLAISYDDTKLHASLRTYWDESAQTHFLVGHKGEPIAIASTEVLQDLLRDKNGPKPVTKLRLWSLQMAMPKVPPIIVAMKAIPGNLSTEVLYDLSLNILKGLINRGLKVISYSSDGTETERKIQHYLVERSSFKYQFCIPNPSPSDGEGSDIIIIIATIDGQVFVVMQDSKHLPKTVRNNNFTGAKFFALGNSYASYSEVRNLAFGTDGVPPLYHRDVEKLDRQDDNVATRLFSSASLEYLSQHFPEKRGQIIYLFVFGELADSYQNRSINHLDRLKMALRVRYFIDIWSKFLDKAKYEPKSKYFISREATDIVRMAVDGLIGLIIIHRDHLNKIWPLLPWLHSSEACEHIFAECRKLVKDFTFLDALYLVPRLHASIRATVFLEKTTSANARASGYAHTYFDAHGIDLNVLSTFPTDEEIFGASRDAWKEAEHLFSILGVSPTDFLGPSEPDHGLPSIGSWYVPTESNQASGHAADTNSEDESLYEDEEELSDDAEELQRIVDYDQGKTAGFGTDALDEHILRLNCAAVMVNVEDIVAARSASDSITPEQEAEAAREDARQLDGDTAAARLPGIQAPPEPLLTSDFTHLLSSHLDFSHLVTIRRLHESRRARDGVRKSLTQVLASDSAHLADNPEGKTESTRRQLINGFNIVLREQQGNLKAIGTGLERSARWRNNTSTEPANTVSGNSANAELAAGQRATTVVKRRLTVFSRYKIPTAGGLVEGLTNAMIGKPDTMHPALRPLSDGVYGIVLHDNKLMLGRVLFVYSQGGGKNATHAWRPEVLSIGAVSYIAMQVYEHSYGLTFRAVHGRMLSLGIALHPGDES